MVEPNGTIPNADRAGSPQPIEIVFRANGELHKVSSTEKPFETSSNGGSSSQDNASSGNHFPNGTSDEISTKKLRRYYKSQKDLTRSISEFQLQLSDYQEQAANMTGRNKYAKCLEPTNLVKGSFILNSILLALKTLAAVLSGSLSLISSAIDSAIDLIFIALLWWSRRAIKKADVSLYPRGRRKLEPVAVILLAFAMSFASLEVMITSVHQIIDYAKFDLDCNQTLLANDTTIECGTVPDLMDSLKPCMKGETGPVVSIATIVICLTTSVLKFLLFLICRMVNDPTAHALAVDSRNDVVLNTSAIAFGLMGDLVSKYIDAVGAIIIALYIIINWVSVAKENIQYITGLTATSAFLNMITWIVVNHDDRIVCVNDIKAFHFGNKYFVEVVIVLPGTMPNHESHEITETLQIKLEKLEQVERVFVLTDYKTGYHHHLTQL